jgi:hypothetical protein
MTRITVKGLWNKKPYVHPVSRRLLLCNITGIAYGKIVTNAYDVCVFQTVTAMTSDLHRPAMLWSIGMCRQTELLMLANGAKTQITGRCGAPDRIAGRMQVLEIHANHFCKKAPAVCWNQPAVLS